MLEKIPARTVRLGGPGKLSRYSWTVRGSKSGGGKFFRTRPDRPCGPPIVLCSNYWVCCPGMFRKCGMEHTGGVTTLLTDAMEQSPSYEAYIVSASQEIPHILWNLKVRYRVHMILPLVHMILPLVRMILPLFHMILPLVRIKTHINPVLAFPFHNCNINFNIILLSTSGFLKCILSFEFLHQNPVRISLLPMRSACPVHLNLLDLTTL
jgi:hypothetical protein